jgi:hypothetical protein
MEKEMRGWTWALAAVAALVMASGAHAQVNVRVAPLFEALANETARREADRPPSQGHFYFQGEVGSLAGGRERVTPLIGGWQGTVTLTGFCDEGCRDLDLVVLNESNEVVAAEYSANPRPVVTFAALPSRTYRMQVRMSHCTQAPCYYAAGAYYAN